MGGLDKYSRPARKILDLNFDERVEQGDLSLVNNILEKMDDKDIYCYSFATKYCVLHNYNHYERDDFVIYDGIVSNLLLKFRVRDKFAKFSNKDLKDYPKYKQILNDFRKFYALDCDFRELDHYLWIPGKELRQKQKTENNKR
ncbi:MAG: hypothetical protein LUC34_06370 [Campylobacter sp.]|nr:hypothetical protein [Campylobacter sp.]